MALILEIHHPDGTRTRQRLGADTLSLGRSLANDIVLDDPFVDARHACITPAVDGTLVIEDLGSVNGMITTDLRFETRLVARAGTEVRLGRTLLRVRDTDEPVPPALPERHTATGPMVAAPSFAGMTGDGSLVAGHHAPAAVVSTGPRGRLDRLVAWSNATVGRLVIIAATFVVLGIHAYLGTYDRDSASDVVAALVAFALGGSIWAGIWAIVSRATTQRFQFGGHFAIVSAMMLAGLVLVVVEEWYSFFLPQSGMMGWFSMLAGLGLLSTMIAWHLSLSSRMPRARRWRAGVLVSVALVVFVGLIALVEDETFTDVPTFSGVVKPVGAGWMPTATVDEFGAGLSELKAEVDELAER